MKHTEWAFNSIFDRGGALQLQDLELTDCSFEHCGLSLTTDISKRTIVRNCRLTNIKVGGCDIGPAVFQNVEIDSFATRDLLIVWGAVFDSVKVSGKCGRVKLNKWIHFVNRDPLLQRPFDEARVSFYEKVNWALDISEARFRLFEYSGIPASAFIRDPESQVIVTRANALAMGWQEAFSKSHPDLAYEIELFLSDGDNDIVLVAPLNAGKAERDKRVQGLRKLQQLGVANPD